MGEVRIGVLTCSDDVAAGRAEDEPGLAVIDAAERRGFYVLVYHVCPADAECIAASVIEMCDAEEADAVFTIGATGLGPRDLAPDVTESVCERLVPGLAEAVRHKVAGKAPGEVLSRATVGIRGSTLVVNLPDGRDTSLDAFDYVAGLLEDAVAQLRPEADEGGPGA